MEKKLFLLGLLRQSDMYGYQINELIDSHFGISISITKPTAYRLLHKMSADGWITCREEKVGNRPVRRIYTITPDGEIAFQDMLCRSLAEYKPAEHPSAVSLSFMHTLPASEVLPLLEKRQDTVSALVTKLADVEKEQDTFLPVIELQRRLFETELAWIKDAITKVKSTTRIPKVHS